MESLQHDKTSEAIQEEEELQPFNSISKLQEHGVNATDIQKLQAHGIETIMGVMSLNTKELLAVKGITEAKLAKIKLAANKIENFGFQSGKEYAEKRKRIFHITTGAPQLDAILAGGLETQGITEVYGEFRTGKTQLCHTVAVTAQLAREDGGGNGKVVWIDSEASFRPERIKRIAERFGVDGEDVLDNILVARSRSTDHIDDLLRELAARMVEESYCLIIVDSLMALFRSEFQGRGQLSERQQRLGAVLRVLQRLSEIYNCAVLCTNQVQADPGGGALFLSADVKKPIGGNILAHAATTRLQLKKGRGNQRICKVVDSPSLAETDAIFELGDGGVCGSAD